MAYLAPDETFVMLENSLDPAGVSWLYQNPTYIIESSDRTSFGDCLSQLQKHVSSGLYAAGWFSYEVGYLLEPRLEPLLPADRDVPLMWFGLFARRDRLSRREVDNFWQERCRGRQGALGPLSAAVSAPDYLQNIERIQEHLAAGDAYQINYTFPLTGQAKGDPVCIHAKMRQAQPVAWGAYIQTPEFSVSSHSPELFLEKQQASMRLRPMKGTTSRGRWTEEDARQCEDMVGDEKSRAENLMIVDLERNDLSRLAVAGSVNVTKLFEPEIYRSVIQMTSTVEGRVDGNVGIADVLAALFPCGSVTGAPKMKAIEIVRGLEETPRGVYTGAIGHLAPSGDMAFNVPIRTMTIDKAGLATLGIGSGIVADSDGAAEYGECMLKSRFATADQMPPCLIETIRWRSGEGYWLLEEHLSRLHASAAYFGYPVDIAAVRVQLAQHAEALADGSPPKAEAWRVRLLCAPTGESSIKSTIHLNTGMDVGATTMPTVALAKANVRSDDVFLFHKTTRRQFLDDTFAAEAEPFGHRDVILTNERGELTEGTRYNLFVQVGSRLFTPPRSSGLLEGTFRRSLFKAANSCINERILRPKDLLEVDKICIGNSLFGLVEVKLAID